MQTESETEKKSPVGAQRFGGKTVIVTGSGDGIGQVAALAFAREGAKVVVSGRTQEKIDDTVRQIRQQGGTAIAVLADVRHAKDVQNLMQQTITAFSRIDILVNNAGIGSKGKPLTEIDEESFDEQIGINTKGTFFCMKYGIIEMLKTGGGVIVNVASTAGLVAWRNGSVYAASKHAVMGLTRTAAIEYGTQGIRINAVCPGVHMTKMAEKYKARFTPEVWAQKVLTDNPATGHPGRMEEAAAVILFLASDDASNIHGAGLPVDGGYVAQ